jgi:hypothetical protein
LSGGQKAYSEDLFRDAVDGIEDIHRAFVHHHDIYPKNMLVVAKGCRNIEVNPYNPVTRHNKHILRVDIMVVDKGLLEYLPDAERLNCVNYSEDLFRDAVDGIEDIHRPILLKVVATSKSIHTILLPDTTSIFFG